MLKRITVALGLLLTPVAALAQSSVLPYFFNSGGVKTPVGSSNPLPVSASVSASISGFPTVQTTGTPISVTTGGVAGTLPAGAVVVASNVGATNAAYCKLGASATTSDQYIAPSGGWFAFTVGANTQLTCITSTSTTTVNMVGGSGLPTGTGGGSGGGGGGGAVTIADAANVVEGALADAAATAGGTGTLSAKLRLATTQLNTINSTLGSPFQAGASIGNTTFAATQATAASLNATVVGTGTFAVQAAQSGSWTLAANQSVNVAQINGVTPLMGNGVTGTGSQRVTIASDNTAFSVNAAQSGTWNITNISGTISLPTLASTSTKQSDGSQKTQIVDGSGNVIASTSNNLNVQCANCSGSGVSAADAATFTAGTSLFAPVGGQFTSGGATACVTGHECTVGMTAARGIFTDMASIAGTTALTGNGTAGAGAQRVTIASDNTAFSVNATLSAETTKVIGTTRTLGNAGGVLDAIGQNVAAPANWLQAGCQFQTSPTTITATNGSPCQMDNAGNILVNVKSATGLAQASTTSGQSGSLVMGAVTTASPSYTTAQTSPLSLDTAGSLRVAIISGAGSGGTAIADGATFTEATTSFTPVGGEYVSGGGANCTTGKGCTWQMTIDRMGYVNVGKINGVTPLMGNGTTGTGSQRVTLASDGTAISTAGFMSVKIDQTTPGTTNLVSIGTNGTVNPQTAANWAIGATGSAVPANAQLTGGTDGTNTRAIATDSSGNVKTINGGSNYETVAASQTAQVMGPTGATGDYLSHCVIYPVTTAAGAVTVFDNTNAAGTNVITFTSGTLSNLAPIALPVGAISTAGAWKVTTGANVTVTCYGKFT